VASALPTLIKSAAGMNIGPDTVPVDNVPVDMLPRVIHACMCLCQLSDEKGGTMYTYHDVRTVSSRSRMPWSTLIGLLVLIGAGLLWPCAGNAQNLTVTTTWLGNTLSRSNASDQLTYLQSVIEGIYVAPDGRVYAQSYWEEGQKGVGIYKNGDAIGICDGSGCTFSHGGVTGDGTYVYFATYSGVSSHVRRVTLDGKLASGGNDIPISTNEPFVDTNGNQVRDWNETYTDVNGDGAYEQSTIMGLAVYGTELFVTDGANGKIHVFNKDFSSSTELRNWSVTRPGDMVADTSGNIWMVQKAGGGQAAKIVCYNRVTGDVITEINTTTDANLTDPRGMAINGAGQLLVADNGPNMQVHIFNITGTPTLASTFGTANGIFSGTGAAKGQAGALKFNYPTGVGVDAAGNYYIAGLESSLESYTPAGALLWKLDGQTTLCDVCQPDPASESDLFGFRQHYVFDYTKPSGNEWTYRGNTCDPFLYPDDYRLHGEGAITSFGTYRIGGQRFLAASSQFGTQFALYRFNSAASGEIAIPCNIFAAQWRTPWPANQPYPPGDWASWVWVDTDGDGQIDANEYVLQRDPGWAGIEYSTWRIDQAGNVWQSYAYAGGTNLNIRKYPFQGLSGSGVPLYTNCVEYPVPAPFTTNNISNLYYDSVNDVMYLSGFTTDYPNSLGDGFPQVGRVICRYNTWSVSPSLQWTLVLPYNTAPYNAYAKAMAFAGDYFFVGYLNTHIVRVYRQSDGQYLGDLKPGDQCESSCYIDSQCGLTAYKRSNGEYVICVEQGYCSNQLTVMRWTPGVTAPPAPTGIADAGSTLGSINITWTDVAGETGYKLERQMCRSTSPIGWTAWTEVNGAIAANTTSYTDTDVSGIYRYAYRLRAYNAGGVSDYSKTVIIDLGNILTATGKDGAIRLNWTKYATATGYKVERSPNGTSGWVQVTATGSGLACDNTGLAPSTTYYYRVRATTAGGDSPYGNVASAATTAVVVRAPLFTDNFDGTSIGSAWTLYGGGTWSESGGILQRTDTAATNQRVILNNSGINFPFIQTIKAKVRMDSANFFRAGLSLCQNATDGGAYTLVFDNWDFMFLDDYVMVGNSLVYNPQLGNWYWMKFQRAYDGTLYGKFWNDGADEPAAWTLSQPGWSGRTGFPGLNASFDGTPISFDEVSVYGDTSPVAVNDSYTAYTNLALQVAAPGVLSNDTDVDSDPLTAAKATDPAHGAVTMTSNGAFTYTPTAGYSGPDSFTYTVSDGMGGSATGTVNITVVNLGLPVVQNLSLWLVASTLTPGTVTTWPDISGHNFDATQTVPANRPTANATALNGYPGVVFNGTNTLLNVPDMSSAFPNSAGTLSIVFQTTDPSYGLWHQNNACNDSRWRYSSGDQYNARAFPGEFSPIRVMDSSLFMPSSGAHIVTLVSGGTSGTYNLYLDGVLRNSSPINNMGWVTPGTAWIGREVYEWLDGAIGEIVLYNQALSDTDRQSVETYLRGKYNLTNVQPTVTLTAPAPGTVVTAPGPLQLTATASDSDGTIAKVEFYQDWVKLGEDTSSPYTCTWSNIPAGDYTLDAVAYDNAGGLIRSNTVSIHVNTAPTVSLTAPTEGQVFAPPANITLTATASDTDGTISKVEFYQGSTLLNTDSTSPYSYAWNGVAAGSYTLTAKAYDNYNCTTTSAAVHIRVNASPSCSITAPTTSFSYSAGTTGYNLTITASATDTDGTISKVDFYNNGILLGTDSTSPYSYVWNTVEASGTSGIGLTAVATDSDGAATTSATVTGTITDSALKCYWKLNETSGTTASDSSGTGNAGTTYYSPIWTACKIANGLSFDGSTQCAQKTSATGLPAANANQTLCCWIYVSSTPTVRKTGVCLTGSSSGSGVYLGYNSSTVFGIWKYSGTALVTTTSLPTAGAWHHVAYVKNGTSGNFNLLYIDGTQVASTNTATDTATATVVSAARTPNGGDYWPGKVDEVRVYNRVLSGTEIAALAQGKQ